MNKQNQSNDDNDLELSLLGYLKNNMLPESHDMNIMEIFQLICKYCMKMPNHSFESAILKELSPVLSTKYKKQHLNEINNSNNEQQPLLSSPTSNIRLSLQSCQIPQTQCSSSSPQQVNYQNLLITKKLQLASDLLQKLKQIFLHYKVSKLSYEMINNYILISQMRRLKNSNSLQNLSEYQNLTLRRVRLDENVKLCIMPQGDSSKIKTLAGNFNQMNCESMQKQQMYVVTLDHVRGVRVESNKINQQSSQKMYKQQADKNDSKNKINLVKSWYTYSQHKIYPQTIESKNNQMTLNVKKIISIEKVSISQHLIGIVTNQKDVLIQPLIKGNQKKIAYQLRLGNLIADISKELLPKSQVQIVKFVSTVKQSKVLLLEHIHNESLWLVANEYFIYVYSLPLPSDHQSSNIQIDDSQQKSCLLTQCYPFPTKACQAKLLTRQYMAVMLQQTPCVTILKLQIDSSSREMKKIYPTNKIYNDIKFICLDYFMVERYLVFTDYGGYLVRLKFNVTVGDVEKEGRVFEERGKKCQSKEVTINLLKAELQLQNNKDRSGLSIYNKPSDSEDLKIVKNSSRQNILLICSNKNTSTLVTYEEMSINNIKSTNQTSQNNHNDLLYDKTIRLWDINFLTVYQSFKLSLHVTEFSLQLNGLYIVTKERGYLGFYPILKKEQTNNEVYNDKQINKVKSLNKQTKPRLGGKIMIQGDSLSFYTQFKQHRDMQKIQQQGYQTNILNYHNSVTILYTIKFSQPNPKTISCLQQIPTSLHQIQLNKKLYILSDTNNDKKYNLHIYDTMGNKQSILKGIKRSSKYNIVENFSNMLKIQHYQFNVILWNRHSFKLLGSNLEESLMVNWNVIGHQEKSNTTKQFDITTLKSSLQHKQKIIDEIYVGAVNIVIKEKFQNDLFRQISLYIFHLQSNRVQYRLNDIASEFQVIKIHNHILLSKQNKYMSSMTSNYAIDQINVNDIYCSDLKSSVPRFQDEQMINLYDLDAPFGRKCLFTLKYKKSTKLSMSTDDLKERSKFNIILSKDRFYIEKQINFQKGNLFSLNNDENFILCCVFKVTTLMIERMGEVKGMNSSRKKQNHNKNIQTKQMTKITHQQSCYLIYYRQLSSQMKQNLNYSPRMLNQNISKISKKVNFEYSKQYECNDRILGHLQYDFEQISKRSNIKNLDYMNDLHFQKDEDVMILIDDISERLIRVSDEGVGLQHNQKIIRLDLGHIQNNQNYVDKVTQQQTYQNGGKVNFKWIEENVTSEKSFICVSNSSMFEIYQQEINFMVLDDKNKSKKKKSIQINKGQIGKITKYQDDRLKVKVQKICGVDINSEGEPVVRCFEEGFNSETRRLWQETKNQMIEYYKKKLLKNQSEMLLDSPMHRAKSSIELKKNQQDKGNNIQINKQSNKYVAQTCYQNDNDKVKLTEDNNQSGLVKLSSSQMIPNNSSTLNNMFRRWKIKKEIQKQLRENQKIVSEIKLPLYLDAKNNYQSPENKEERIKFLMEMNKRIKNSQISEKRVLNYNNVQKAAKLAQINDNNVENISTKIEKTLVNEKILNFERNLQKSVELSKIIKNDKCQQQSTNFKTINSTNIIKRKTYSSSKKSVHSFLTNNDQYQSESPEKLYSKYQETKSKLKIKTEMSQINDRNNLEIISKMSPVSKKKVNQQEQNRFKSIINPQSPISCWQSPIRIKQSMCKIKQKKRCKTQTCQSNASTASKDPLIQLKSSEKIMRESILPQIKSNRQKLNQKMKEKKSYMKYLNEQLILTKQQIKLNVMKNIKNERKL